MGRDTGSAAQSSAVPIIKPGNGEPVVTLAAPTPVVLPTPAITERVRFDAGAYGATLTGSASQAYTLWALASAFHVCLYRLLIAVLTIKVVLNGADEFVGVDGCLYHRFIIPYCTSAFVT